jgi:hypothetical protein
MTLEKLAKSKYPYIYLFIYFPLHNLRYEQYIALMYMSHHACILEFKKVSICEVSIVKTEACLDVVYVENISGKSQVVRVDAREWPVHLFNMCMCG